MRTRICAILAAVAWAPATAAAQATRCNAINTDSTRQIMVKMPSGQYNTYLGGGVVVHCPAKKINLRADSMEQYGDDKRFYLVGHVYYQEPRFNLHSDFLNYFMADERVVATGNVDATMPSGSRLKGPVATYLRPIPKTRPLAQMTATGRPTITLVQQDSTGKPAPPMQVVANNVFMDGDSLVYAGGDVQIARQEFTAHGDSMFLDGRHEIMHLLRGPEIQGKKDAKPFTLVGTLIDLFSRNRKLRRVVAKGKAVANSQDLKLRADTIDLRLEQDVLDRAIAWGPGRASARSATDSLLADSIDVVMPGQRAREIHAIGHAYAESKPDTVKFRTKDMDWMKGDTIIAYFDTLPAKDTAKSPQIRRLVSIDSASAFYNMAPRDTSLCAPAVSYSVGQRIIATFKEDGGVKNVDVIGKSRGLLLEPTTDSTTTTLCGKPPAKKPPDKKAPAKPPGHPVPPPGADPIALPPAVPRP